MPTEDQLLGWSWRQWIAAEHYYNLCHPEAKLDVARTFYSTGLRALHPSATVSLDPWLDIMDWWNARRLDQPGNNPIIVPEVYRARSPRP